MFLKSEGEGEEEGEHETLKTKKSPSLREGPNIMGYHIFMMNTSCPKKYDKLGGGIHFTRGMALCDPF